MILAGELMGWNCLLCFIVKHTVVNEALLCRTFFGRKSHSSVLGTLVQIKAVLVYSSGVL